jgi:trimeric autotransporter adhesin
MKRGLNKENSLPDPEFGGESSESARAIHYVVQKDTLMTYVSARFAQADPGIVSGSTIERKQMSTKTIYKRIALVAVTALGAGVLSVAPASANTATQTGSVTGVTDGTTAAGVSVVYAAGSTITATVNVATATTLSAAGDFIGATVAVTGPSLASPAATDQAVTSTLTTIPATSKITSSIPAAGTLRGTFVAGGATDTNAQPIGTVSFVPSRAGVYTITVTPVGATIAGAASTGGTRTAGTFVITVGSDSVLVPTVGTSITANNAAVGQSGGLTAYRFQPSGFNKAAAGVSTYFATVDAGSIDAITNGPNAGGTGGIQAMTNSLTNGVNNSAGFRLTSTIGTNNAVWNAGGTQGVAVSYWDITLNAGTTTTQTLTIRALNATTGAITTIATAVSTYGAAPAISAANSTEFIGAGTGTITSDAALVVSRTAGTVGNITITLKDQYNANLGGQTISATISGSGLIRAQTGHGTAPAGDARATSVVLAAGVHQAQIGINSDGTAGVGTITISAGTTVLATKTITFYGAVATLTAKQNHRIASSAGAALGDGSATPAATSIATTPAVVITAKDSLGNAVPGLTITAVSSDTTVMSESLTVNGDSVTSGNYNVAVTSVANTSGKTATLTFRVMSGTTVLAATAPVSYTLGGAVASVALSLNKASYSVGEAAVATITVKDAAGNAAFDADHANILTGALASSLSVVKALQFNTTNTSVSSLGGVSTVAFNAPGTSGTNWTISGTTGTGPSAAAEKGKALTATAAVTSGSDVAALTTLINSLIAKINALNKLVIKIQKKVRA